jgi:hypothetical protein
LDQHGKANQEVRILHLYRADKTSRQSLLDVPNERSLKFGRTDHVAVYLFPRSSPTNDAQLDFESDISFPLRADNDSVVLFDGQGLHGQPQTIT